MLPNFDHYSFISIKVMGDVMNQKLIKGELLLTFQMLDEYQDAEHVNSEWRSLNNTFRRFEKANLKKQSFKGSFDDY